MSSCAILAWVRVGQALQARMQHSEATKGPLTQKEMEVAESGIKWNFCSNSEEKGPKTPQDSP